MHSKAKEKLFDVINYNKTVYRAGNQNWDIDYDANGYVYFGNNLGLLEFDGVTWTLHESPNGAIIRTVAVDADNRIYTGGYREIGFWEHNENGDLIYTSLTEKVEHKFKTNEEFWNILIFNDTVYFHCFSGVFIYHNGEFTVLNNYGFTNYATCDGKAVYCTVKDRGIYKVTLSGFEPVTESKVLLDKNVRFVSGNQDGTYLIGFESHGIYRYYPGTNSFKRFAPEYTTYLSQNKLNNAVIDEDGNIIIGTILDGVSVFNPEGERILTVNKSTGLQTNTVLGLKTDTLGNIWVAMDKGVDFISFPKHQSYKFVQLSHLGAVYTAAVYNGMLYIGTNQGLFRRDYKNQNDAFELVPGTQEQVWECKVLDNKLFVGHNSGTFVIDGNTIEKISKYSGGYSLIRSPHDPNMLLQCTYSNLVKFWKDRGEWRSLGDVKGFNNLIRFVEFDHQNNLWASHLYQGIYKLHLSNNLDTVLSKEYFGKETVLNHKGHNANVFKVENRIVFAGHDQLYTYNDLNDSIVPYTALNKKLGKYAVSSRIIPAPDHRYWFVNKEGIGCFEIRLTRVHMVKDYPVTLFKNKMIPRYENVVPVDKENAIVCLEDGYALINTRFINEGSEIENHRLVLREVRVSDRSGNGRRYQDKGESIKLPFKRNNLQLRYSFPVISAEENSFVYEVEGLTDAWSDPIDKPLISLSRIPPGNYKVKIKAVNGWGKSSPVFTKRLIVKPPFVRSFYAIVLYIFILGTLFYVTRYLTIRRVRIHEKRKQEEKENELIKLRNENLQNELSFKSEQLANSTMGIIRKNEFLMSLKRKLKRQKESLGNRFPDKYYKDLMDKIDQNISGRDDWKVFEHNFEKAHEAFLKTLKLNYPQLTPGDMRLCAYLKLNLSSKEIAPLLGVSVRGVENHRYRLRKKFDLAKDQNLTEFILEM